MNFELASTPIQRGTTLIEASAGTGKTYTIAGIYLRLIVEERLTVENILVVTFTEAATAELRDRIRKVLSGAAADFERRESDTPYIQTLIEQHRSQADEVRRRIERAIRDFDQSAIFTIHGFCQRALKEHAFESGILFDTELITDETRLVQETIEDFWRRQLYTGEPVLVQLVLRKKAVPDDLSGMVYRCLNHADAKIITRNNAVSRDEIAQAILGAFQTLKELWRQDKETITGFLTDLSWARQPLTKEGVAEGYLNGISACLENSEITPGRLGWIEGLCSSALAETTRKKHSPPQHEFFDQCERLKEWMDDYIAALEVDCIRYVRTELSKRKRKHNVQFFQDLLSNLHDALQSSGGHRFARSLREKYKAALIDEFQDTDPLQYAIFNRVFGSANNEDAESGFPHSFLFLIGDPKQAIYSFRGADIFTYLKAAPAAQYRYTLPTNYRSETPLVHAVNTMFQSGKDPFVFPGIQFQPVAAQGKADAEPLLIGGNRKAPMQFWIWEGLDSVTKEAAEKDLPPVIAAEICRLLKSDATLGGRRLRPSDFAVLVLENNQAQLMQDALREKNIPSVLHTNESLFATHEASEVLRFLSAVAEPSNERLVRGALATDMVGLNALDLNRIAADEQVWQEYLELFHGLHETWVKDGFIQMFRQFLNKKDVRKRLLAYTDGERRLTNVLHLSEVLHEAALERQIGPHGLLKWLSDQMGADGQAAEENQLRLESDENAVQLVTVHKSKGLEYPIVFCPFSWKPAKLSRNALRIACFHDNNELTYDLGSDELAAHQEQQLAEELAERMRLLYVAVTRARNRCYVVWGNFKDGEHSALAYLLHQPPSPSPDIDLRNATAARFKSMDLADLKEDLCSLQQRSVFAPIGPAIAIGGLPEDDGGIYRATETVDSPRVREFAGRIESNWRITSFSSLKSGLPFEMPDYDSQETTDETPATESILSFPTGTRSGICIHQIFQALDFTAPGDLETLVSRKLNEHGFSEAYVPAVCAMVENALNTNLDGIGLLNTVALKDRLDELEFYYPLKEITPNAIDAVFRKHNVAGLASNPPGQIGRLRFEPVQGFMKGFVDSIIRRGDRFYIVDWKSNLLGNSPGDYTREAMRQSVLMRYYHLQYHIYALALHRYLQRRLPGYDYERHFGGVYYIFLRGLDPARPDLGIFFDRPGGALMNEFDKLLIPG